MLLLLMLGRRLLLLLILLSVLFGEVGNTAVTKDIINCELSLMLLRRLLHWLLLLLLLGRRLNWIAAENVQQIAGSALVLLILVLLVIVRVEAGDGSTVLVVASLVSSLVLIRLIVRGRLR